MPNAPFLAPDRDGALKWGRPKQGSTTYYTMPGVVASGTVTTFAPNIGTDYYAEMWTPTPLLVDQLAIEVTGAESGKSVRIGIYPASTDWQPAAGAAPLADSGDLSITATGVKTYTPGTPIYVPRGRFLTVVNTNSAISGWRAVRGHSMTSFLDTNLGLTAQITDVWVARTYAAFPTPGTAWTTTDTSSQAAFYFVFLRVSSP